MSETSEPVACARCGQRSDAPPATWTRQGDDGRTSWLCERCTRENLRAIEGKLDDSWW